MNSLTVSSKRVQRSDGKKLCLVSKDYVTGREITAVLKIAVNNAKSEM